jgi:hypothetical protein
LLFYNTLNCISWACVKSAVLIGRKRYFLVAFFLVFDSNAYYILIIKNTYSKIRNMHNTWYYDFQIEFGWFMIHDAYFLFWLYNATIIAITVELVIDHKFWKSWSRSANNRSKIIVYSMIVASAAQFTKWKVKYENNSLHFTSIVIF